MFESLKEYKGMWRMPIGQRDIVEKSIGVSTKDISDILIDVEDNFDIEIYPVKFKSHNNGNPIVNIIFPTFKSFKPSYEINMDSGKDTNYGYSIFIYKDYDRVSIKEKYLSKNEISKIFNDHKDRFESIGFTVKLYSYNMMDEWIPYILLYKLK